MRLCIALCALWPMWIALGNAGESKIVCYYDAAATRRNGTAKLDISDIDPTLCTHLVFWYVQITKDGDLDLSYPYVSLHLAEVRAMFQEFNTLRKISPGLKTLVATNFGSEASATYSQVAANVTLRRKYVTNVVNFLRRYKFDGFSIDWVPSVESSPDDYWNYVLLLEAMREGFDEHNFILSAWGTGNEAQIKAFYDISEMSRFLHIIILSVSVDVSTAAYTRHPSPLYPAAWETSEWKRKNNVDSQLNNWLRHGAPAEKMILATTFNGRSFVLKNSSEHVPGSPSSGPGQRGPWYGAAGRLDYNDICNITSQDSWTTDWDAEQRASYAYSANQWITFENVRSISEKAKYAKSKGLGGVAIFTIEKDDNQGNCGERFPLLKALNRVLRSTPSSGLASSSESGVNVATTSKPDTIGDSDEDARKKCVSYNYKYVRDSHNCAKFWICVKIKENDFNVVPFRCGNGLYFDTDKKACKSENLVECSEQL